MLPVIWLRWLRILFNKLGRKTSQLRFRPHFVMLEDRVVPAHFYSVSGFTDGAGSLSGGTGTSGDPFVYTTLRGAIDAADSDSGSTITLPAGTYQLTIG